jgi:hypothetical protein
MSDIYVTIRTHENRAMTSVEGIPIIALVRKQDRLVYDEQPVSLRFADAHFYNLPLDTYTVIARHPLLNPIEAMQNIELKAGELVTVRFVYLEPERQLLRIEVFSYSMDD